jgi:hypothetical protein
VGAQLCQLTQMLPYALLLLLLASRVITLMTILGLSL